MHTLILISPRTEVSFGRLYSTVCKESENLTSKRTPNRINSGTPTHWYPDTKDRYRHIYFKALELATREIKRRFDQEDLYVMLLERLKISNLQNYFTPDIDQNHLKFQLSLLSDMTKSAYQYQVHTVTNVRTIVEAMNKSEIYKSMLTDVYKLLQLYFTFPVTTSTAEGLFLPWVE